MSFIKTHLKTIIIVLIVVVIAIIGVNYFQNKQKNSADIFDPKNDTIVTPKRETIKDEIALAGSVDATGKANLTFQTPGQLAWLGVKVGDRVKKYQAIASLNKDQLRKQLEISYNNYKSGLSTFDDTQAEYKDRKENLTLTDDMKRILNRSQNTLNNSVAAYELNDLTIKYATLTTPIEGIVVNIDAPAAGVNITPASGIFVIDPKSIFFKSEIDQEDVIKIKVGDKATIQLDSYPDKYIETKVDYIAFNPVAGQSSTVYEVRIALPQDNSDLQYRLGMDGDIRIELKENTNALTVPVEAIRQEAGQTYVYIKNSNSDQLIKKTVKTGIETDTNTEILEGLSENDSVVIKK